jgi:soluble lytic murein transglycosylase-like protein
MTIMRRDALSVASLGIALFALIAIALVSSIGSGIGILRAGAVPARYEPWILRSAAQCPGTGMSSALLAAQLEKESRFNPRAVSPAGAQGIAQFLPATFATWGRDEDGNGKASPTDPADAIMAQGRMMCALLTRAEDSGLSGDRTALALAGYNAGWGAVQRYGGIPPYAETQTYVAEILERAQEWTGSPHQALGG